MTPIARDKVHIVAMTGSYFRGEVVPLLTPEDEAKFELAQPFGQILQLLPGQPAASGVGASLRP